LKEFSGPVIDWARANGLLPNGGEEFTPAEFASGKAALLAQSDVLQATIASFHQVISTRREMALADLLRVFPGHAALDMKVLARRPDNAPGGSARARNAQHASLVDLHLAGQLASDSQRWHSTSDTLDYPVMATKFHLLSDVNRAYGEGFSARDGQLWTTYAQALQYSMCLMKLSHRKRLEHGALTLMFVSQLEGNAVTRGRFGILVICQHPTYVDCAYEFFPRQLTIVERADLNIQRLLGEVATTPAAGQQASATTRRPLMLPLDWEAYGKGAMPTPGVTSSVMLETFAYVAPATAQATAGDNLLSVPPTVTSFRIRSLASDVLNNSLFATSLGLRISAGSAISLDDAIHGRDPWAEYLQSMAEHAVLER
jgi:hypothetical protein